VGIGVKALLFDSDHAECYYLLINCSQCISAQDPYCDWSLKKDACVRAINRNFTTCPELTYPGLMMIHLSIVAINVNLIVFY